jgi:hypothetical protein
MGSQGQDVRGWRPSGGLCVARSAHSFDQAAKAISLGKRPVPLDPASWQILRRRLDHRSRRRTANPAARVLLRILLKAYKKQFGNNSTEAAEN